MLHFSILSLSGLLICIVYFYLSLRKIGGVVEQAPIPTSEPPRNLSPASIVYMKNNTYDEEEEMTVALVDMAVKGAITIDYTGKDNMASSFSLVDTKDTERLRPEEKKIHAAVFANSDREWMRNVGCNSHIKEAIQNQKTWLSNQKWGFYGFYEENKHIGFYGLILLYTVFTLYMVGMGFGSMYETFKVALPVIAFAAVFLAMAPLKAEIMMIIAYLFVDLLIAGVLITIMFLAVSIFVYPTGWGPPSAIHWPSVLFFTVTTFLYCAYIPRLKRLTPEGAQFEGFKMYLQTDNEQLLNLHTLPERTPELFERLLPYAVAFGVTKEWCKKFDDVFIQSGYRPKWFEHADGFHENKDIGAKLSSLCSSLKRNVMHANTMEND